MIDYVEDKVEDVIEVVTGAGDDEDEDEAPTPTEDSGASKEESSRDVVTSGSEEVCYLLACFVSYGSGVCSCGSCSTVVEQAQGIVRVDLLFLV